MAKQQIHAVTGAYGYSGKYIAEKLLERGHKVITLTNSLHRKNPFGERVPAQPFNFDNPEKLAASLRGVEVLYNTYWVRFNYRTFTQADAVNNTLTLFNAARQAGVRRIVHVSIANPSTDSHLEYFSSKAGLERALKDSGISQAILRPTVLFGKEDILINNIAWMLRKFPLFLMPGDGSYRIQPIYVDDLATLAVDQGESEKDCIIDAIGPETFTFRSLVETIGKIIGKKRTIIGVPPTLAYGMGYLVGKLVNDVMITREEVEGLMAGLLYVDSPPAGKTKLTEWARSRAASLGSHYSSELARRLDREKEYAVN